MEKRKVREDTVFASANGRGFFLPFGISSRILKIKSLFPSNLQVFGHRNLHFKTIQRQSLSVKSHANQLFHLQKKISAQHSARNYLSVGLSPFPRLLVTTRIMNHQDDISCLGSGIPIKLNLHLPHGMAITGKGELCFPNLSRWTKGAATTFLMRWDWDLSYLRAIYSDLSPPRSPSEMPKWW